jgi:AraC-like DNA-binding protein
LKKYDVRSDTRGILDPQELMARVAFRRVPAAPALRPYVEHYWLIDWELDEPYEQHVLPHPSVNVVFMGAEGNVTAEVSGVGRKLFSIKLDGTGGVAGAQFRPGGYHPFHRGSVSELTGRRVPLDIEVAAPSPQALDAYLLSLDPQPDPQADLAMSLADAIRQDRSVLRVDDFARASGMSVRAMQRLFSEYVGVSPKWVILRYRIQEAIEVAGPETDWARLAADLGYSDQAHLVRDFTSTIGVSPAAYGGQRGN